MGTRLLLAFGTGLDPATLARMGTPQNNKMQRTSHGQDGGSPLILVLSRRYRATISERL
jgi:hypothetical protein